MKSIRLVGVGAPHRALLDALRLPLYRELGMWVEISSRVLDPHDVYHPERDQYLSTALLAPLRGFAEGDEIVVGVTGGDLFVPILTYVFGEAEFGGRAAVVSFRRLADPRLLLDRLLKETVHEIGHIFGLTHCHDYECVMSSSHGIEWIDLKSAAMCDSCHRMIA